MTGESRKLRCPSNRLPNLQIRFLCSSWPCQKRLSTLFLKSLSISVFHRCRVRLHRDLIHWTSRVQNVSNSRAIVKLLNIQASACVRRRPTIIKIRRWNAGEGKKISSRTQKVAGLLILVGTWVNMLTAVSSGRTIAVGLLVRERYARRCRHRIQRPSARTRARSRRPAHACSLRLHALPRNERHKTQYVANISVSYDTSYISVTFQLVKRTRGRMYVHTYATRWIIACVKLAPGHAPGNIELPEWKKKLPREFLPS